MTLPFRRWPALAALAALGFLAACSPDRLRPGPPSLVLTGPEGSTVTSPDTMGLEVFAQDDNGLDSVTVTILDRTEELDAFDQVEVHDVLFWPIPEGLTAGTVVEITGYAKDLVGERTTVTTSVTVIAGPPPPPRTRWR